MRSKIIIGDYNDLAELINNNKESLDELACNKLIE